MHRFGRGAVIFGLVLTVLGVIVGFGALFMDADELAKPFIALIPVGFLAMFAGLTVTLMSNPEKRD